MAHRIEISCREGLRDVPGEKLKRRIKSDLGIEVEDARVVDQSSGYSIDGDGTLTVEVFVETEEEISVEAPFTP